MKKIIHLSDLHFRLNWEEDQELVLHAFFKDLSKQIEHIDIDDVVFIFSGDMVKAGEDMSLYDKFIELFDVELDKLNIKKEQRYCVPGNHDISAIYVKNNFVVHEGIVTQNLSEKKYNDFVNEENNFLINKFENYKLFEKKFVGNGISEKILSGKGFLLENNIGIYCINSATCSSGGYDDISDKGRLGIDTRSLHKWINECKASIKILVMHHNVDFLTDWAKAKIR